VLLLALDTSGEAVTAAVHDGHRVLAEESTADPRRHAELLAPAVAAVLAGAGADRRDLSRVVVGVGPGPFTGLRVGVVTARVLGDALGVPVHGLCSLDALAAAVVTTPGAPERFLVAADARRREVYWAPYLRVPGGLGWARTDGPHVSAPGEVEALVGDRLPVAGRGALLYPQVLGPALPAPADVSAGVLAQVAVRALALPAAEGPLLPPDPLYLRRPDAVEPGPRKRVLR
jgi:tRNA threonylcarbamoyl adenosine modification protein YeaZ